MSVLNKIASLQNRRDEIPNQELACELVSDHNLEGIREIAEALTHADINIQNDCIKVLYEIGYLNPALIAGYTPAFIKLLKSRHNRMVWGAMLALSTAAELAADEIYPHLVLIMKVMGEGSVITVDNAVKLLAILASKNEVYANQIFPFLLDHLRTCRPKDVPQHAEKIQVAANPKNKAELLQVLGQRAEDLSGAQLARVKKVMRTIEQGYALSQGYRKEQRPWI